MPIHLSPGTTRWDDEELDARDAARDAETDVALSSHAMPPRTRVSHSKPTLAVTTQASVGGSRRKRS
jgi:hypothetical protein